MERRLVEEKLEIQLATRLKTRKMVGLSV